MQEVQAPTGVRALRNSFRPIFLKETKEHKKNHIFTAFQHDKDMIFKLSKTRQILFLQ